MPNLYLQHLRLVVWHTIVWPFGIMFLHHKTPTTLWHQQGSSGEIYRQFEEFCLECGRLRFPWCQARNVSRHIFAILIVFFTKTLAQTWFLWQWEVKHIDDEKNHCPDADGQWAKNQGFADEYENNSRNHRISHIGIRTCDNEFCGGIPWGRSAIAKLGK